MEKANKEHKSPGITFLAKIKEVKEECERYLDIEKQAKNYVERAKLEGAILAYNNAIKYWFDTYYQECKCPGCGEKMSSKGLAI